MVDTKDPLLEPLLKAAAEDPVYQSMLEAIQNEVEIDTYPKSHPSF